MYENQWKVKAEVKEVALIEPKEAGNWPSLAVKFEYAEENGTDAGDLKTTTSFMYFTEKAIQYTEENLRTLGWDPIKNSWQIDDMIATNAIIGARVQLVLEEEEYEGKRRIRVKFINALGGKLKGIEPKAASDFTRTLQKRLGVSAKPKTMATATAAKPAPRAEPAPTRSAIAADDPDNIPF